MFKNCGLSSCFSFLKNEQTSLPLSLHKIFCWLSDHTQQTSDGLTCLSKQIINIILMFKWLCSVFLITIIIVPLDWANVTVLWFQLITIYPISPPDTFHCHLIHPILSFVPQSAATDKLCCNTLNIKFFHQNQMHGY